MRNTTSIKVLRHSITSQAVVLAESRASLLRFQSPHTATVFSWEVIDACRNVAQLLFLPRSYSWLSELTDLENMLGWGRGVYFGDYQ